MKTTKAKRKLIPKALFAEIVARKALGVPLSRIIKDLNLDISRTSLSSLLKVYEVSYINGKFDASLFPPWLKDKAEVQKQPDSWYYQGHFPWGSWQR